MKLILFLIPLLFTAVSINASEQTVVFQCLTEGNKQINISSNNSVVTYTFGRQGVKPEIKLNRMLEQLDIELEIPVATGLNNSIKFNNGIYSYLLTESVSRLSEEHESSAWLEILKNDKLIKTLDCLRITGSIMAFDKNYLSTQKVSEK